MGISVENKPFEIQRLSIPLYLRQTKQRVRATWHMQARVRDVQQLQPLPQRTQSGIETILEEIMTKNFQTLMKKTQVDIPEVALMVPGEKSYPGIYVMVKLMKTN